MESDEELDDSFLSAIDQLVAQHKQTQPPPRQYTGSQPSSPYQAPPVAAGGGPARQPPAAQLPPTGLFQQQHPSVPLQQINGFGLNGGGPGPIPKPPLAVARHQQGPPSAQQVAANGVGAWPPAASGGPTGQRSWAQHPPGSASVAGHHPQDLQARLNQLQADLSRSESEKKLMASNLQQKDRELTALRQVKARLERAAQEQSGAAAAGGGWPGGAKPHFAVGEMQRQLESAQKQLAFKEAEMEDLKRAHAERSERLRQAEATLAELKEQLRKAEQQAAAAAAAREHGLRSAAAAATMEQRDSGRSMGQGPSSAAVAPRSGGQKRRQSTGVSAGAAAAAASGAAAGSAEPAHGTAAAAAAAAAAPLLDPAVLAAACTLTGSSALLARIMAVCNASMALLMGAASSSSAGSPHPVVPAPATTALLLRSRLAAAAAQVPDADSRAFVGLYAQRVQQVACGMLPPAVLLDSIGSLVAASLAQLHSGSSDGGSSPALPDQRVHLVAAGLQVAQHLVQLDAGCQAAALAPMTAAAPGSAARSSAEPASLVAPQHASSRVSFACGASVAAPRSSASSSSLPAWSSPGSGAPVAALPGTALLVQRHMPVFAALQHGGSDSTGGTLVPVVLAAALWLGQQHEAVLTGALGTLLEIARCLQGVGAQAVLAPVLLSGAMELFMQPPALRMQALHLLRLLLEDPSLAQLFESSLVQAAAVRGEPGPPTATAGTSGGGEGAGASTTPARNAGDAGGGGGGQQAMQLEGGGRGQADPEPWTGAALIAERLLESFVLDDGPPPAGAAPSQPASSKQAASTGSTPGSGATAAARAAMQLVAMLREQRQHNILVSLLLDDACGAPGCMLAQRLVQLADAATAPSGDEPGPLPLCPAQWPRGPAAAPVIPQHQQLAWQQRLRVVQEALTLLRGLLMDDSCGVPAMDDLVAIPAAARLTLTTLSRLARLEAPPPSAAGAAPAPGPLPPAPWAQAIGSSSDHASVAEASGSSDAGAVGGLSACSVEDVVRLSKSCRRRVLARLQQSSMQQGSTDDRARCGVLNTPSGNIDTPALLVYSHRGSPLNLTPDMLEKLKPDLQSVQLDVLHFLSQPKPEVLRRSGGSGRRFLALDGGYVLFATARDPAIYEYTGAMRQATDQWASVSVHTGALSVTPAQYMEGVAALGPDAWVPLSDDVPSDSRSDRAQKAVDRSVAWLKECLTAAATHPGLAGTAIFAAVQGGQYVHERQRCAEAMACQPGVTGYVLAGLGTGESPSLRQQIVEAVLRKLPEGAPRLLSTVGSPEEVLEAVGQGIDLFDMDYLADITAGGYALTFPLTPEAEQQVTGMQAHEAAPAAAGRNGAVASDGSTAAVGGQLADAAADFGQDDSKFNLWALAYRTDRRPLLPGCACFTCRNHTRAYIHHLLQSHEMTVQVLLELHNTHHYLQFFKAIRSSIAAGTFAAYRDWWLQQRQRWLVGQQ